MAFGPASLSLDALNNLSCLHGLFDSLAFMVGPLGAPMPICNYTSCCMS